MILRVAFIAALLSVVALAAEPARAEWKQVSPQDLSIDAAQTGDPQADAAILLNEGELNDNSIEGTILRVYVRIKIFTERGRAHADIELPYRAEIGKISDVRGRTIRPDGTIVELEDRDIFDRLFTRTSKGVWRARVFSMPSVEAGSIIEYRYRQTYPARFRYFAIELQSDLYTRQLTYRILPRIGARLDLRWVTFNANDPSRFTPVWDGSFIISAENIPAFRREPMMPPDLAVKIWGWLYYSDEIETDPDKYWRNYARRTFDRLDRQTSPSRAIRRVVNTITLSTDTAAEKIERIYNYVQNEIHNVGGLSEEQMGGLKRNQSANDTIHRRYGTPEDINRLFVAMLRAAGLDARVAAITTRNENFFRRSFPDAFQLNGEVAAVLARDGSARFYDPGTPHCPPGLLPWEKESVTALIFGRRDWKFVETPIAEATVNNDIRTVTATVDNEGHVRAQVEATISGQRAIELQTMLPGLSQQERDRLLATSVGRSPAVTIDETTIGLNGSERRSGPVEVTFRLEAPNFAPRTERRLLLRPALLNRPDESFLPWQRRENDLYFQYPWSEREHVRIELPEGFAVEQLPPPVALDMGAASYRCSFHAEDGALVYHRTLLVNAIFFPVDQFQAVKEFFDRVHQADRTVVAIVQQ